MLKEIEEKILSELKEHYPEFEIDGFPVDFERYTFTSPKGCILLRYEDRKNSTQTSITAVNTDKTTNFTLFTAIRYAQKHSDCYGILDGIEEKLNGLPIFNKRLVVKGGRFESEINGDLWYSTDLSIEKPAVDIHKDLSPANEVIYQHTEEII